MIMVRFFYPVPIIPYPTLQVYRIRNEVARKSEETTRLQAEVDLKREKDRARDEAALREREDDDHMENGHTG